MKKDKYNKAGKKKQSKKVERIDKKYRTSDGAEVDAQKKSYKILVKDDV